MPLFDAVPGYADKEIMVKVASKTPPDGVTPFKTKEEIDEIRLEAALGHKQELKRNFGLWSLTSLGIVIAKCVSCFRLRRYQCHH